MIKTKGLTKKFSRNEKEFYTLKDVSLHVGKGEFVGSQLYIDDVELIYDYQE